MSAWVIPLGLIIGLAMGALGGGGSIMTVPALVYLLHQDARVATTGSLIIVGISSIIGVIPHLRAGRVRVLDGVLFGLLGVAGSYAGSRLSAAVPVHVLLSAFAALMYVVAALMTRRRRAQRRAEAAGQAPADRARVHPVALVATATGVGLLTGFFGVGGGFAVVPALVLALGLPMPVAVGTSLLVISINSATAFVSRLGGNLELDWPLIVGFSVFAVIGSLLGGVITRKVSPHALSLAFTLLLVVIATYTAAMNVPALFA